MRLQDLQQQMEEAITGGIRASVECSSLWCRVVQSEWLGDSEQAFALVWLTAAPWLSAGTTASALHALGAHGQAF